MTTYIKSLDEVPPPAYVVSGASLRAIPPGDERGIRYRWPGSPAVQNNYEFVVLDSLPDGYELRGIELVRFPDGKRAAGHAGQKTCSTCQAVWWMDCDEVAHKHPLEKRGYDQDLGKIVGEALTGAKAGELAYISLYNGEPGSPTSEVVYSSYARIEFSVSDWAALPSVNSSHGRDAVLLIADEVRLDNHHLDPRFNPACDPAGVYGNEPILVGHQLMLSKEPTEWLAVLVVAFDARMDMFTLRPLQPVCAFDRKTLFREDPYASCYLGDEFELGACALLNLLDTNLTRTGEELAIVETPPASRRGPTTRYKPGTVDVGWDPE